MGKKKTTAAKRKASKVTKKLTTAFAKKLGVSTLKPEMQNGIVVNVTPANDFAKHTPAKAAARSKVLLRRERQAARKKKNQKPRDGEPQDFENERRSVQERHRAMEWKLSQKGRRNAFAPLPPTFDTVKTTSQLLGEATQRIGYLDGIGKSTSKPPPNSSLIQLAGTEAASHGRSWGPSFSPAAATSFTEHDNQESSGRSNPWSALRTHDSDSDDEVAHGSTPSPGKSSSGTSGQLFHFAPPSFQPPSSNLNSGVDLEDDPDL